MPQASLEVDLRPDRTAVAQGAENPFVRVWLSLRAASGRAVSRPPATVVVLLDCSGTVRRFLFEDAHAQQRWLSIARSRGELEHIESDRRRGFQFTGQTLTEVRRAAPCALAVAADALKRVAAGLRSSDVCCVVGFASEAGVLYDGRRRLLGRSLEQTLDAILRDPSAPNLGDGTRLRDAARIAAGILAPDATTKRVRRLVVITDGIVEDQSESMQELERMKNEGVAVTAIGLGHEFDEEFLIRLADWTGGSYHFAARALDIEAKLAEEFGAFASIAARDLRLSVRGLGGAVVTSVTQVLPQMRMFEEIRLKDDWFQVEVGDVSGSREAGMIGEFSLPALDQGSHAIGELHAEWTDPESGEGQESLHRVFVECRPAGSPDPVVDAEVEDMALRLQVYREERAAQWAREGGRRGISTVRLRAASELLRKLGQPEMADQVEQQAADVESDDLDSARTKMVKDWIRRLGQGQIGDG